MHRGKLPLDYGSVRSMREVWNWAKDAPQFHAKHVAKHGRWFQITTKTAMTIRSHAAVNMAGTYMGLIEGWALADDAVVVDRKEMVMDPATFEDKVAPDPKTAIAGAPAKGDEAPRAPVANSNQDVDKLRRKCSNMLHLVTVITGNESLHSIWVQVLRTTKPVSERHSLDVTLHKTIFGCRQWRIDMSAGHYTTYIKECFGVFDDVDVMIEAAMVAGTVSGAQFLLTEDVANDIAGSIWKYVLN
jgi:hypothetical protein